MYDEANLIQIGQFQIINKYKYWRNRKRKLIFFFSPPCVRMLIRFQIISIILSHLVIQIIAKKFHFVGIPLFGLLDG